MFLGISQIYRKTLKPATLLKKRLWHRCGWTSMAGGWTSMIRMLGYGKIQIILFCSLGFTCYNFGNWCIQKG